MDLNDPSIKNMQRSANYDWIVRNIIKRIPSVHLRTSFQHERNFEVYAESLLEPARKQLKENPETFKTEKQTLMTRLLTMPLSTTGKPVDDKYVTCECK